MAIHIWALDMQQRFTPTGWDHPYYWTNCFHCLGTEAVGSTNSASSALFDLYHDTTVDTCQQVSLRKTRVSDGFVGGIQTPLASWGELDSTGAGFMGLCARMSGRNDGVEVGYKRWRIPMRDGDLNGGYVADLTIDLLELAFNSWLAGLNFCTVNGDLITEWVCNPLMSMWQLRRGSKRQERKVYGYP